MERDRESREEVREMCGDTEREGRERERERERGREDERMGGIEGEIKTCEFDRLHKVLAIKSTVAI